MRPKLLFVYESRHPVEVRDGLWAALELLRKDYDVTKINIGKAGYKSPYDPYDPYYVPDIILGWGAFGSKVDTLVSSLITLAKRGLCIGGTAGSPDTVHSYDAVFYETQWDYDTRLKRTGHGNLVHAFGVNTDLYHLPWEQGHRWIDWLTVGALSYWKRLEAIIEKPGVRMCVGEVQRGNMEESMGIAETLLVGGCGMLPMVESAKLSHIYSNSANVLIPASLDGGGERAVLEARACGCQVEISDDNPKLQELMTSPVWDHRYYADQLRKGINSSL